MSVSTDLRSTSGDGEQFDETGQPLVARRLSNVACQQHGEPGRSEALDPGGQTPAQGFSSGAGRAIARDSPESPGREAKAESKGPNRCQRVLLDAKHRFKLAQAAKAQAGDEP